MVRPVTSNFFADFQETVHHHFNETSAKVRTFVEKHSRHMFFGASLLALYLYSPYALVGGALVGYMAQRQRMYTPEPGLSVTATVFAIVAATMAVLIRLSPAGSEASLTAHSIVWIFSALTWTTLEIPQLGS